MTPIYTKNSIIFGTKNRLLVYAVSARVVKVPVNITGFPIVKYNDSVYNSKILYSKISTDKKLILESINNLTSLKSSTSEIRSNKNTHTNTRLASFKN